MLKSAAEEPLLEGPSEGERSEPPRRIPSLAALYLRAKAAVSAPATPPEVSPARQEAGGGWSSVNAVPSGAGAPGSGPPRWALGGSCSSSVSRAAFGVLLVLLAAGVGAIGGALFDHSRQAAELPPRRPKHPAVRPKPGGEGAAPSPPFPPLYVGPEGGEPPEPPVCHFTQPSNANDPTASEPGDDADPMRSVEFVNECEGDLMVNLQGFTFWDTGRWKMQALPSGGGFPLKVGESRTELISERMCVAPARPAHPPDPTPARGPELSSPRRDHPSARRYSGRIWARPNCRRPCNIVSCGNPHNEKVHCTFRNGSREPDCMRDGLWCDTGNCPGGNETTCRGEVGQFIGGLPPGPLLELTLCGGRGARIACYKDGPAYNAAECDALPTADYYDISNVDGTSRIWAGMEVVRGRKLAGPYAPQGAFNCGGAFMPGAFDMRTCPQPLRVARNDSNPHGYSPNASVADAIGCLSACNFMSQVAWSAPGQPLSEWVADRRLSQARMETPTQDDVSHVTTEDVARTCCECGHLGDRGLCPAPKVNPDGTVRAAAAGWGGSGRGAAAPRARPRRASAPLAPHATRALTRRATSRPASAPGELAAAERGVPCGLLAVRQLPRVVRLVHVQAGVHAVDQGERARTVHPARRGAGHLQKVGAAGLLVAIRRPVLDLHVRGGRLQAHLLPTRQGRGAPDRRVSQHAVQRRTTLLLFVQVRRLPVGAGGLPALTLFSLLPNSRITGARCLS